MDCGALLSTVTPQQHFGHPEPPNLCICEVEGDIAVVAYSSSHLAIQYKNDIRSIQIDGITTALAVDCEANLFLLIGTEDSTVFLMDVDDKESICHEVLPGSMDEIIKLPSKGIQSILLHDDLIWIVYRDGNMIRFPLHSLLDDEILETMTRYHINLPPIEADYHILPLGKPQIGPLTPVDENTPETIQAVVFPKQPVDLLPTLFFYTSENHFVGRLKGIEEEKTDVFGRAKKLVSSAFRWTAKPIDVDTPWSAPPVQLFVEHEFHDAPRTVLQCALDQSGKLLATADNLGRIAIFDLQTKQLVRLLKGFRQANCHFVENNGLLIHSRHRNVAEIYRMRYGDRTASFSVPKEAIVLADIRNGSGFVLRSSIPGLSSNTLERIKPQESKAGAFVAPSKDIALRLQQLQQMLSAENTTFSSDEIFEAFSKIETMTDLAVALDYLSVTPHFGLEPQKKAIGFCKDKLAAEKTQSMSESNPVVQILTHKIKYHSQLVKAYEVLNRYETTVLSEEKSNFEEEANPDQFCIEAIGWASVDEQVKALRLSYVEQEIDPLSFTEFVSCCARDVKPTEPSDAKLEIHFSDSSRIRRAALFHVFRPLLGDPFSFHTTMTVLECLGIQNEFEYLLNCFAEWFITLESKDIGTRGLFAIESPLLRFLSDIAKAELNVEEDKIDSCLETLYEYCKDCTDLVRAFALASICRKIVIKVGKVKEESSYGKVSVSALEKRWARLLRKLRLCLLVSLRLKEERLGASPLSVNSVDSDGGFSVYDWIARDELKITTDYETIRELEKACLSSSHSFDPTLREGDAIDRFHALHKSCLFNVKDEVRGDDSPLLLFLKRFIDPARLEVHRTLLLAKRWRGRPENVDTLRLCADSLKRCENRGDKRFLALVQDIWQSCIAPIYCARLFGSDDVQEFDQGSLRLLLRDSAWWDDFTQIALEILDMIGKEFDNESSMTLEDQSEEQKALEDSERSYEESWPSFGSDYIIDGIMKRSRRVNTFSYQAHVALVCAMHLSEDVAAIAQCMPCIYDCFQPLSLFNEVSLAGDLDSRSTFIDHALRTIVMTLPDEAIHSFSVIEKLEMIASIWDDRAEWLRTRFLLQVCIYGKDSLVDELLTSFTEKVDTGLFIEESIDIVCYRLFSFLSESKSDKQKRNIFSLLDPELCEWIKQKATRTKLNGIVVPSIATTRLLVLRMLALSSQADVETPLRVRIHSLSVMCGTIVHASEHAKDKS